MDVATGGAPDQRVGLVGQAGRPSDARPGRPGRGAERDCASSSRILAPLVAGARAVLAISLTVHSRRGRPAGDVARASAPERSLPCDISPPARGLAPCHSRGLFKLASPSGAAWPT